jgi:uncharacterized DUF497 family protein
MSGVRYEWDEEKNISNMTKHGISFDEAVTVFLDENLMIMADEDHSVDEERFIIIGLSKHPRLLVVCHCYKESDEVVRIISARKATKTEERVYRGKL